MQLAHYATRGRKFEIKVFKDTDGTYSIREYINGQEQAASVGNACMQALYQDLCRRVQFANICDGIRYEAVNDDKLSLEMVQKASKLYEQFTHW